MTDSAVLQTAYDIINGPRRSSYGDVTESFSKIAQIWSVVLHTPVTPQQVALCMIGLKICRESNAHNIDNLVDIAGYTELCGQLTLNNAAKGAAS